MRLARFFFRTIGKATAGVFRDARCELRRSCGVHVLGAISSENAFEISRLDRRFEMRKLINNQTDKRG